MTKRMCVPFEGPTAVADRAKFETKGSRLRAQRPPTMASYSLAFNVDSTGTMLNRLDHVKRSAEKHRS